MYSLYGDESIEKKRERERESEREREREREAGGGEGVLTSCYSFTSPSDLTLHPLSFSTPSLEMPNDGRGVDSTNELKDGRGSAGRALAPSWSGIQWCANEINTCMRKFCAAVPRY